MSFRWKSRPVRVDRTRGTGDMAAARARRARRRPDLESLEGRTLMATSIPINGVSWTPIGPASIGGTSDFGGGNGGPASGRIAAVAADPSNANTLYIAAAGGGVWKTLDGGKSWSPLTDNVTDSKGNPVPMFMGAIAVAPSNPQVLYAGTGEANNSGDSYYGEGILKSTDGGGSWTLEGESDFFRKTVSKIVVSPTDAKLVYAAVSDNGVNGLAGGAGIWKSTDGGTTWTNTTASITTTDVYSDLVIDPSNPQTLYAAVGTAYGSNANGVYKTTDGGTTWTAAGNYPGGVKDGRINLAISASKPQTLYASVSDPSTLGLLGVEKSTDGGTTWTATTKPPEYLGTQGDYNNIVAVSPTDPNNVFVGGVINYGNNPPNDEILQSTDGGSTWFDVSTDANGNEPHTDEHGAAFDAKGRFLVVGDGGIWRLDNAKQGSIAWADLNSNLQITEFTGIALDPTNADFAYGGSQDNGTEKFSNNLLWTQIFGGDGGFVRVDASQPQTVYTENYYAPGQSSLSFYRSDDGGKTFNPIGKGIGLNDAGNFYIPYILDPSNPSHVLYATDRIYSSVDRGDTFTALSTPGKNGWTSTSPIDTLAIAPSDPNTIYAEAGGQIFVSTDGGANWTERDVPGASDTFNDISVDPSNSGTAYIVRGAFNDATDKGHVFQTTDAGATWKDITGNLPDLPATAVVSDSRAGYGRIYVGTDAGVYSSTDSGQTWTKYATNLPNVRITALELNPTLNVLAAGTYGRGMFEIQANSAITITPTTGLKGVEGVPISNVTIATFVDARAGEPLSNYTVTIAWGDGQVTSNAQVVSEPDGSVGIVGSHTFAEEGTYAVTITVDDSDGASAQTTFDITVGDAPLAAGPLATVSPTEGQLFTGVLGTFIDTNKNAPAGDFTATIDWGDGTQTKGRVAAQGNGTFAVSGTHTYVEQGLYPFTITVSDVGGAAPIQDQGTADVADAPLTGTPHTVRGIEGGTLSGTIGSFVDTDPNAVASDYTVVVDWGDGSTSTVVPTNRGTQYDVVGTHVYTEEGTYAVNVQVYDELPVTDSAGDPTTPSLTVASTAIVADASLSATSTNNSAVEGQSFSGVVAVFTDGNTSAPVTDYGATVINWGDGSTSAASISTAAGGKFNVSGSHTYAEEGSFTVTVNVADNGGSKVTATGTMSVADAALSAQGTTISGTEGLAVSGLLANFSDFNLGAPASDFTPTIDWGDGATTTGTATQVGPGVFAVSGSHVYPRAQTFTISIKVADDGGSTTSTTTTANIADAPLTALSTTVPQLVEGQDYTKTVATFSDGNPNAVPSDFVASIDWGDQSTSFGVLTPSAVGGGTFSVSSGTPHTYAEEGAYTATVSVVDLGGAKISVKVPISVADAPIKSAGVNSFQSTEGASFSGLVATFAESPNAPLTDFSASISWGDGHTSAGTVSSLGNGSFGVSGSNAYSEDGTYDALVTIRDVGGSTAVLPSLGIVADAPISSGSGLSIAPTVGGAFTGVVTAFGDANPNAPASDFTALITWGDGSAATNGTIAPLGNGVFSVTGSHTYAVSGDLPYSVSIFDKGSSITSSSGTAHVLFPLTVSSTTTAVGGITNKPVQQFSGQSQPGASIVVLATPASNPGSPIVAGQTYSGANGNWAIVSTPLPDGVYALTATMTDSNSGTQQTASLGTLTVDTTGPQVVSTSLDPARGQLRVVLYDNASGLRTSGLTNPANFSLALVSRGATQSLPVTGISLQAGAPGTGQIIETVSYSMGRQAKSASSYVVTINAAGVTDNAGNTLVERTFLLFPGTGSGPVNNYVAQIDVSPSGSASAPHLYIPQGERVAAAKFGRFTRKHTKFSPG